ncbi:hypothetical protein [Deinococcus wulumuqiensis]|uniref:hypothetical protein n=1 Tax=Deinococcus wulumuqiensis TaxID=980427 RepID=UPI0035EEE812
MNINVGIQYLAAWLRGSGAVPIHNLMEDAATAEISRAQLWQWLRQGVKLEDGRTLDQNLFDRLYAEEVQNLGPTLPTPPTCSSRRRRATRWPSS